MGRKKISSASSFATLNPFLPAEHPSDVTENTIFRTAIARQPGLPEAK